MIGRPPRSPLFPYPPLFRFWVIARQSVSQPVQTGLKAIDSMVPIGRGQRRSEEHTSELQSHLNLVCRLLLEKKKYLTHINHFARPRSCKPQTPYEPLPLRRK